MQNLSKSSEGRWGALIVGIAVTELTQPRTPPFWVVKHIFRELTPNDHTPQSCR